MNNREYIRITKSDILDKVDNLIPKCIKNLNNDDWIKVVLYFLLDFYQNYNKDEFKKTICDAKNKGQGLENTIAKYIRRYLNNNGNYSSIFSNAYGEVKNDESDKEGYYDITISNTYWKDSSGKQVHFFFECKNLNKKQDSVNKYVYYNKGNNNYDGGVYRYFNGKYAKDCNFGGMIGFVLEGDMCCIKNKIKEKLACNFSNITPEGDLINLNDNSIEKNNFTFESTHKRKNTEFLIYHILFTFTL